jgi:hypothetical protein
VSDEKPFFSAKDAKDAKKSSFGIGLPADTLAVLAAGFVMRSNNLLIV